MGFTIGIGGLDSNGEVDPQSALGQKKPLPNRKNASETLGIK